MFEKLEGQETREMRVFKRYLAAFGRWSKAVKRYVRKFREPDPYFLQISENTGKGYSDGSLMKTGRRDRFKGGVWLYAGKYLELRNASAREVGKRHNSGDSPKAKTRDKSTASYSRGKRKAGVK